MYNTWKLKYKSGLIFLNNFFQDSLFHVLHSWFLCFTSNSSFYNEASYFWVRLRIYLEMIYYSIYNLVLTHQRFPFVISINPPLLPSYKKGSMNVTCPQCCYWVEQGKDDATLSIHRHKDPNNSDTELKSRLAFNCS